MPAQGGEDTEFLPYDDEEGQVSRTVGPHVILSAAKNPYPRPVVEITDSSVAEFTLERSEGLPQNDIHHNPFPPKGSLNINLFDSYLTPKAAVGPSHIAGRGIIATEPIARDEVVAIWGGHLITWEEMQRLPPEVREHPVQVWHGLFLGPTRPEEIEPVDYMNHSCEPTCGVKGQVIIVARRDIAPGEELTFDYATTDTVGLDFECHCGAPTCRGRVTSDDWRNPEFRKKHEGYLSLYIQEMANAQLVGEEPCVLPAAGGHPGLSGPLLGRNHQEARLWPTA